MAFDIEVIPGPEGAAPSVKVTGDMPLVFPFQEWVNRILVPTISVWSDQFTGGIPRLEAQLWGLHNDLLNPDYGLIKAIILATNAWVDPDQGGIPRLEAQLWGLHNDLLNPDYGLIKAIIEGTKSAKDNLDKLTLATELGHKLNADTLKDSLDQLNSTITDDPDQLEALLAALAEAVKEQGQELGFPEGGEWQLAALARLGPLLRFLPKVKGLVAGGSIGALAGRFLSSGGEAATALAALAGFVAAAEAADPGTIQNALAPLNQAFQNFYSAVHHQIVESLRTGDPQDLDAAETRAANALAVAMGGGLAAHLFAVALERFAPGKAMGLGQVSGFLADMGSFNSIARATWTHLVDAAIGRPLDQKYNVEFPTRIPPFGEVLGLARKHEYDYDSHIDELGIPKAYYDDMARLGIPPTWVQRFWRYQWMDPRLYDIVRMADVFLPQRDPTPQERVQLDYYRIDPNPNTWWLNLKFKKAGYDFIDVPMLTDVALGRLIANEKTRLTTQWRNNLRDGYVTTDQYTEAMRGLGERQNAIDIQLQEVSLTRHRDHKQDVQSHFLSAYLRNQTTFEDLRVQLAGFIADPEELDFQLFLAQMKHDLKARETVTTDLAQETAQVQTLATGAYRRQYQAGLLSDDQLIAALVAIGLTQPAAAAILLSERTQRQTRLDLRSQSQLDQERATLRRQLEQSYTAQYQASLIDEPQLLAALTQAGFPPDLAAAILAQEWANKIRRLSASQQAAERQEAARLETALIEHQRQLLRHNLTTPDQAFATLTAAGIPEARARELIGAEVARATGRAPTATAPVDRGPAALRA